MTYILPDISILNKSPQTDLTEQQEQAAREGDLIEDRLDQLGMRCNIEKIDIGPSTILFSAIAAEKIQVRLLPRYAAELAYELGSESVSIQAPIPGEKYVGITISNPNRRMIYAGDVIHRAKSPLEFPLGVTSDNQILSIDIRKMPHLLIGGTTGSGKSVGLHNMICSLLMATTPDELLILPVDTKMVELTVYDGIPNLICDCVTDGYEAVEYFQALVKLMEDRYHLAQEFGAKSLDELNQKLLPNQKLPYILVVVDEVADLMMINKHSVEESIVRIAQKGRACGMNLVVATQSPRREVITGLLKSNLPSRLAFATSSSLDSRIIIDKNGAQNLLGNGDFLFSWGGRIPTRIQSPYINQTEISSITNFLKSQNNLVLAA